MRYLSFSNVVSAIALIVALATFAIDYLRWHNSGIPPEVFWRPQKVDILFDEAAEKPYTIFGEIEFSVTNRSSQPQYLVSCKVAGYGLHTGAGGYGERLYPCEGAAGEEIQRGLAKIEPGQTRFFPIRFSELLSEADMMDVIKNRGLLLDLPSSLQDKEAARSVPSRCSVTFSVSASGGGWSQNCPAFRDGGVLYSLLIQTGDGDTIRKETFVTSAPDWPWGRLERYVKPSSFLVNE